MGMIGFSQEIQIEQVFKMSFSDEKFIGIDKYNHLYSLNKNILFKKRENKTDQFSALGLGEITSVDILNPLKIVVFYSEINTVVLLDDRLNEIQRINFNELSELKIVDFVGNAGKNNLWIFNSLTKELEIFDYKKKKSIAHTQPVMQEILQLQSNFNYCWLLTSNGLLSYNSYGSFVDEWFEENIADFRFYNNYFIYQKEKTLYVFDIRNKTSHSLELPKIDIRNFYTHNENIYIYDGEFLHHYTFNFSK